MNFTLVGQIEELREQNEKKRHKHRPRIQIIYTYSSKSTPTWQLLIVENNISKQNVSAALPNSMFSLLRALSFALCSCYFLDACSESQVTNP